MRKFILPTMIAAVFAMPAIAQVNVGGVVRGAAGAANRMQIGTPLGTADQQADAFGTLHAGMDTGFPPLGKHASSRARGAARTANHVAASAVQGAGEVTGRAGSVVQSTARAAADNASQNLDAGANVAGQARGSGAAMAGTPYGASTDNRGNGVSGAVTDAQRASGNLGTAVRGVAHGQAQGAVDASQTAVGRVNGNSGQASANSELGANVSGGASANGAGVSVQGGASVNAGIDAGARQSGANGGRRHDGRKSAAPNHAGTQARQQ